MAEYSGMNPSIMSPHQFGGVSSIENTSTAPDQNTAAPTSAQQNARMVLATTDQAARRTGTY